MGIENENLPLIGGILFAGGRSRRFEGADKGFQCLAGKTLVEHVVNRTRGQVAELIISCNGDRTRYSELGLEVVVDEYSGHQGPYAGLVAGIAWFKQHRPDIDWVATFPVDGPFAPLDLVARLAEVAVARDVPAIAASAGRCHAVYSLWPLNREPALRAYLAKEKRSRLVDLVSSQGGAVLNFADALIDPFFNVNQPKDLIRAEEYYQKLLRETPAEEALRDGLIIH